MLEEIGTVDRIPEYHQAREGQERQLPPDGLRPSRLQELRSARQGDADPVPMPCWTSSAMHDDPLLKVAMELETHRAAGRVFHREEALSQHRFLFRHHAEGAGLSHQHVHRAVRAGAHRGLDRAVEGDARGPAPEDRPPAPDLYRRDASAITCRWASANSLLSSCPADEIQQRSRAARSDGLPRPRPALCANSSQRLHLRPRARRCDHRATARYRVGRQRFRRAARAWQEFRHRLARSSRILTRVM